MSNNYKSTSSYGGQQAQDSIKSESKDLGINSTVSGSEKNSLSDDKIRNLSNSNKDKRSASRDSQTQNQKSEFDGLQSKIEDFGESLKERGQHLSHQVANRVRNNPWAFVGGASVLGLAIGYFMGRRRTA